MPFLCKKQNFVISQFLCSTGHFYPARWSIFNENFNVSQSRCQLAAHKKSRLGVNRVARNGRSKMGGRKIFSQRRNLDIVSRNRPELGTGWANFQISKITMDGRVRRTITRQKNPTPENCLVTGLLGSIVDRVLMHPRHCF